MGIHFCDSIAILNQKLSVVTENYPTVCVLADSNTEKHCLPLLKLNPQITITIPAGEIHKNLNSLSAIWEQLTTHHADRKALLINVGGGMITDIGGFAGATYKRGIDFINIPTSLLAQVDAAVGGKTGIDFLSYKNQIGTFSSALHTFICTAFFATLPKEEYRAGLAEIIKHYLIANKAAFYNFSDQITLATIEHQIAIKNTFVEQDPKEKSSRKALNFGHTIGHALESYYLASESPLLHGEAVAAGMLIESHISLQKGLINHDELNSILHLLMRYFADVFYKIEDVAQITALCYQDKKNSNNTLLFSLLNGIGGYATDQPVSVEEIKKAITYYNEKI